MGVGQHVLRNAIDDVHLWQREAIRAIMTDLAGGTRIHTKDCMHSEDSQERSTLDKPNVVSQQEASDILDEKPY